MALPLIGAVVVTATIAIHVESADGVSPVEIGQLTETLQSAIERRTGERPRVDTITGDDCDKDDRCITDIKARTERSEVVFVNILGVPNRVRLLAERVTAARARETNLDLDRTPDTWTGAMDGVATILFPEATPTAQAPLPGVEVRPPPPPVTAPTVAKSKSPIPWIILSASAAVGVGAVLSGLASANRRKQVESGQDNANMPLTATQADALADQTVNLAWVANGLYAMTAVGVSTSILWLVVE